MGLGGLYFRNFLPPGNYPQLLREGPLTFLTFRTSINASRRLYYGLGSDGLQFYIASMFWMLVVLKFDLVSVLVHWKNGLTWAYKNCVQIESVYRSGL